MWSRLCIPCLCCAAAESITPSPKHSHTHTLLHLAPAHTHRDILNLSRLAAGPQEPTGSFTGSQQQPAPQLDDRQHHADPTQLALAGENPQLGGEAGGMATVALVDDSPKPRRLVHRVRSQLQRDRARTAGYPSLHVSHPDTCVALRQQQRQQKTAVFQSLLSVRACNPSLAVLISYPRFCCLAPDCRRPPLWRRGRGTLCAVQRRRRRGQRQPRPPAAAAGRLAP